MTLNGVMSTLFYVISRKAADLGVNYIKLTVASPILSETEM